MLLAIIFAQNYAYMSKGIILLVTLLLVGFLSSCKSHERCPAYSKVNTVENVDKA